MRWQDVAGFAQSSLPAATTFFLAMLCLKEYFELSPQVFRIFEKLGHLPVLVWIFILQIVDDQHTKPVSQSLEMIFQNILNQNQTQ